MRFRGECKCDFLCSFVFSTLAKFAGFFASFCVYLRFLPFFFVFFYMFFFLRVHVAIPPAPSAPWLVALTSFGLSQSGLEVWAAHTQHGRWQVMRCQRRCGERRAPRRAICRLPLALPQTRYVRGVWPTCCAPRSGRTSPNHSGALVRYCSSTESHGTQRLSAAKTGGYCVAPQLQTPFECSKVQTPSNLTDLVAVKHENQRSWPAVAPCDLRSRLGPAAHDPRDGIPAVPLQRWHAAGHAEGA